MSKCFHIQFNQSKKSMKNVCWQCPFIYIKHSIRENITFICDLFFFKANSLSSLVECTWTLERVVVGKKPRVVDKSWLERPIQANLLCIWENNIYDILTCHVTISQIPCYNVTFFDLWHIVLVTIKTNHNSWMSI